MLLPTSVALLSVALFGGGYEVYLEFYASNPIVKEVADGRRFKKYDLQSK
jgi:hypothetical protein